MVDHHVLKLVIIVIVCSNIMVTNLDGSVMHFDSCNVTSYCGTTEIRFPFHLKQRDEQHKKDHCIFPPAFQLACSSHNYAVMEFKFQVNTSLPDVYITFSTEVHVGYIDYRSQKLEFYDEVLKDTRQHYHYSHHNHSHQKHDSYLSNSPFKFLTLHSQYFSTEYTIYNCSNTNRDIYADGYYVYPVESHMDLVRIGLKSCTKMYDISDVSFEEGWLTWSTPDCSHCEAKGKYCKFKPNSTIHTQCYPDGMSWNHSLYYLPQVCGDYIIKMFH